MREKIYILAILLLASSALGRVRIRKHLQDGTVLDKDDVEFRMADYFNLYEADMATLRFEATQSTGEGTGSPVGKIFDWKTDFNKLQYDAQTISFIKPIDERSFILFDDAAKGTYQEMSPNASIAKKYWSHNYGDQILGRASCQDAILNGDSDEIWIGCATNPGTVQNKALYLARIVRADGSLVDKPTVIDLGQHEYSFKNRLKLGYFDLPQGKQTSTKLLIIYDQGRMNQQETRETGKFFVAQIVTGQLVLDDLFQLKFSDSTTFDNVYDFFDYQGVLMVSAAITGKNTIQLLTCQLDISITEVICSTNMVDTGIPTTRGYVTRTEISDLWAEYSINEDLTTGTLTLYDLNGKFGSENWRTKVQSMDKVPANDMENQWIRDIEGSLHNIAIQWSKTNSSPDGLQAYDVASVVVSWTLGRAEFSLGSSLAILGDNGFFANIQASDVHVRRLDKPFFWAQGREFGGQETNIVTIRATDKDNSAAVTAHIQNNNSPQTKIVLDFKPPYLDVFGGSIFHFPLTHDSWISGNGLKFSANFNDPHFDTPIIAHSGNTTVTFRPPPPVNRYKKIMFGETGAVTIEGSNANYYTCQFMHGSALCDRRFFETISLTAQHQDGLFSKHGVIGHWSQDKNGKTQVYITSFNDGLQIREFDYLAESVAFTMDWSQNLYVAVSNFDQGYVEVWRKLADISSSWERVNYFDAEAVGLPKFCPGQLRADPVEPTTFHTMSHCQTKGDRHGITRIVSLPLNKDSGFFGNYVFVGSGEDSDTGIVPQFCPMGDHHIIYTNGMNAGGSTVNSLYAIDKRNSFSRFNIDLQKAGFSFVNKFECFSDVQMYTIHGPDQGGIMSFGLFWGDKKYNNKKFANLLINDLSTLDWSNLESYYTGEYIIHVGYKDTTTQNFAATLTQPPRIQVKVNPLSGEYDSLTPVTYTVKAKSGLYTSDPIQGTVYARRANETIGYSNKKAWISGGGWLDIEQFTRIDGPVTSVKLIASDHQLSLRDRKANRGVLDGRGSPTLFDTYRGSATEGVGLTAASNIGSFYFIHDHEIQGTTVRYGADGAFDYNGLRLLGGVGKMVLYHGKDGPSNVISAFVTNNQKVTTEATYPVPKTATKIRLAPNGDNRRFLGFSYDMNGDNTLTVFRISYDPDSNNIEIHILEEIDNVYDFDACTQSGSIYVYYTRTQSTTVDSVRFSFDGMYWNREQLPPILPNLSTMYWLTHIAAAGGKNGQNHIAVSTHGTVIYAGSVTVVQQNSKSLEENLKAITFTKFDKFQNFEGRDLFINEDLVVAKSHRMEYPYDGAALVWKRTDTDRTLHTAIEFPSTGKDFPVSFFTHEVYGNTVAVGTLDNDHPLQFFSIHNVEVFLPNNYEDLSLSNYKLFITGTYSQTVTVADMLSGDTPSPTPPGPTPPTPGYGYWPFIGVLVFLLFAAIVWFSCARKAEGEEDPYKSVDPATDSGLTEGAFETGLRPEEIAGQEFGSTTQNRLAKAKDEEDDDEDLGLN